MRLKNSFALAILASIMGLQLVYSQPSDAELTKQYVNARRAWLLLICFECGQIYTFSNRGSNQMFATSAKPAGVFNTYLKRAKVSLPNDKTRKREPSRFE